MCMNGKKIFLYEQTETSNTAILYAQVVVLSDIGKQCPKIARSLIGNEIVCLTNSSNYNPNHEEIGNKISNAAMEHRPHTR